MSEGVRMWLDDVRDPATHGHIGWTWCKTYEEAIALLATGTVEAASLDHDLSPMATIGQPAPGERTGYDVVCWMEANGVWPRYVYVHSMNPSGAARMKAAILRNHPRFRAA